MTLTDLDHTLAHARLSRAAFAFGEMCADKVKPHFDGSLEIALHDAARAFYACARAHRGDSSELDRLRAELSHRDATIQRLRDALDVMGVVVP